MSDDTHDPKTEAYLATLDPATREFFELMSRDEPLHEDLLPYFEENGPIGPMLRHPLVYEMVIGPGNARINLRYAAKLEALEQAKAEKEWQSVIWIHERPHRLDALKSIEPYLTNREFWMLARDVWVDSENIWQHFDEWLEILNEPRGGRTYFMTPAERKLLKALPDEFTIYRGAHEGINDDGLSWTLDKERAAWFAKRFEHHADPVVLTGMISKAHVHAYVPESRGEDEVIPRHPEFVRVTRIEAP